MSSSSLAVPHVTFDALIGVVRFIVCTWACLFRVLRVWLVSPCHAGSRAEVAGLRSLHVIVDALIGVARFSYCRPGICCTLPLADLARRAVSLADGRTCSCCTTSLAVSRLAWLCSISCGCRWLLSACCLPFPACPPLRVLLCVACGVACCCLLLLRFAVCVYYRFTPCSAR